MSVDDPTPTQVLSVGSHWQALAHGWAARRGGHDGVERAAAFVGVDVCDAQRPVTVRFTTARDQLVTFMTTGRLLAQDQLATAAAAACAWNTKHLVPMLSLWDVRGTHPCLAGVCVLPLTCRLTLTEFDDLVDGWVAEAREMFLLCHKEFGL